MAYTSNDKLCCCKTMTMEITEGCCDGCCFGVYCKAYGIPCWGLQCDEMAQYTIAVCFPVRVTKEKARRGRRPRPELGGKGEAHNINILPVVICDCGQACIRVKDTDGNEIEGAFATGEDSPLAAAKMERA